MARQKSVFVCQQCGYESSGWLGKCPACLNWNTFVEEASEQAVKGKKASTVAMPEALSINDIQAGEEQRDLTGIKEMDRVLGGGFVKGSLVLVGGDPGIGKSTLLLQVCQNMKLGSGIIYISGEESVKQIKLRANRLNVNNPDILTVSETRFEAIEALINAKRPGLVNRFHTDNVQGRPLFRAGQCEPGQGGHGRAHEAGQEPWNNSGDCGPWYKGRGTCRA